MINDHERYTVADELAACETRMFLAERELELLGWLPTAAFFGALERVERERERQRWLLRRWRQRDGTSEDAR